MIERTFVQQNFKEFQIKKFIVNSLSKVGLSSVKLQRTSLGEKIIIRASRPGLIVGRGGVTIQKLTRDLKKQFQLENPQIEIEEIKDFSLDATVVAESIVNQLERFGTQRFKGVGHKTVDAVMRSGALGVEVLISGKIPSSRSKTWRFANGYMKKCGDLAISGVDTAKDFADLKTGVVGVQVRIMPGSTVLPDQISFDKREKEEKKRVAQEAKEAAKKARKEKITQKKESAKKETSDASLTKTSSNKNKDEKSSASKTASKKSSKKQSSKETSKDSDETKKSTEKSNEESQTKEVSQ